MPKGLILPYIFEDSRKESPFTREMEAATLLALADEGKRRPMILLGEQETVEFISKVLYPVWAIPWGERSIIIDGLKLTSDTLTRFEIPDVKAFTEDLMRCSQNSESYKDALKRSLQLFEGPFPLVEVVLEAFIGDEDVLKEFYEAIEERIWTGAKPEGGLAPIPPRVDPEEALERAGEFTREWRIVKSQVAALRYAVEVLEDETAHYKNRVEREIEHVTRFYEEMIASARESAEKEIKELVKRMNAELREAEKTYARMLKETLKKRERLRKAVRRLEGTLETYLERRESSRRKGSNRGVKYWDGKVKKYKRMLSEAEDELREAERLTKELNREREEHLTSIKERYRALTAQEAEKVNILEARRDREVKERRKSLEEIEEIASQIKARIELIIEELNRVLKRLVSRTMPWKAEEATIIWTPSYVVKYRSQKRERYKVHPPINVEDSEGVLKKIQRAILSFSLEYRILSLVQPRSGALERRLFKTLEKRLEADKALREIIDKIGESNNLLEKEEFKDSAVKGLRSLEEEGWISPDERSDLLRIYLSG